MTKMFAEIISRGKPLVPLLQMKKNEKIALVVPGGTFQGTRTAGMMCALEKLSFSDYFHAAYGVSCGAANIAYFLTQQSLLGASIYYQDVLDNRYLGLRWPPIDTNYLVYEVIGKHKKLDCKAIKNHNTIFKIPFTNDKGRSITITIEKDLPTLDALRIGMSMGFYAGNGIQWNGSRFFDGMMSNPIPFRDAIQDGYKNLLVMLNMPLNWDDKNDNILLRLVKFPWIIKHEKEFKHTYFSRQQKYKNQLRELYEGDLPSDVNVTIIAPSKNCIGLPLYTRNSALLRRGVEEGVKIIEEVVNMELDINLL